MAPPSPASRSRSPSVLIAGLLLAFTVGRYPVSLNELASVLFAQSNRRRAQHVPEAVQSVILQVRGPRVLAAALIGAALAVAGTAFQGLFRNPLVSPDILGASSGAALGAVIGIFFSLGVFAIQALAFAGGLAAVAAVYLIGSLVRARDPILVLVLTGVVVGALLGAGVGLMKYLADPYNQLPAMTFWLLGSLAATTSPIFCRCSRRWRSAPRADRAALAHERHVAARGRGARPRLATGRCASSSWRRRRS